MNTVYVPNHRGFAPKKNHRQRVEAILSAKRRGISKQQLASDKNLLSPQFCREIGGREKRNIGKRVCVCVCVCVHGTTTGNPDEKIGQPTIRPKWTRRHNLRNYAPSCEPAAQLCTCIYRLNCTTAETHTHSLSLSLSVRTDTHTHTRGRVCLRRVGRREAEVRYSG